MYEAQQGQTSDKSKPESELQILDAEANGDGKEQALKPLGTHPDT